MLFFIHLDIGLWWPNLVNIKRMHLSLVYGCKLHLLLLVRLLR